MPDPRKKLDLAQKTIFYFFLLRVFAELEGEPLKSLEYVDALCLALQQATEADAGRLLVTIPPRHLKSVAAAIALPAWVLGRDPSAKVMVATYSDTLSAEHAAKFARVVNATWYQRLFPNTRVASSSKYEWRTTAGGARYGVSLGGTVTGFGADVIIIDDILKGAEARQEVMRAKARLFYTETLRSRLDNPRTGSIIAIMQRLHEDDFPAFLLENGRYRHLNLPATAEETEEIQLYRGKVWLRKKGHILDPYRFTEAGLADQEKEMGRVAFAAQYQQRPVLPDGAVIDMKKIKLVDRPPERKKCTYIIQSWDTAVETGPKCSFSVCTTWGYRCGVWYLLDLLRARLDGADLKSRILQMFRKWSPEEVLIERTNATQIMWSIMRQEGELFPVLMDPDGSKLDRLVPHLDYLNDGAVAFPTEVDWWPTLRDEMRAFPESRFDDQVDSLSQFMRWARSGRGQALLNTDPVTGRPY
ncbi:phage terminase large subunit [Oceanicaulis alexandrii]|uniref:phage terminase large subunit n=1 Tax=Oceanicaulis alexandrii TaxID=153233 RepID=UPI0023575D35|nr:phage terminase large subunit [Oceanicaulis alexandrii]